MLAHLKGISHDSDLLKVSHDSDLLKVSHDSDLLKVGGGSSSIVGSASSLHHPAPSSGQLLNCQHLCFFCHFFLSQLHPQVNFDLSTKNDQLFTIIFLDIFPSQLYRQSFGKYLFFIILSFITRSTVLTQHKKQI